MDQDDENGGSEKRSDSLSIWKGKSTGFPNKLDMEWERKRSQDYAKILAWAVGRMESPLVKMWKAAGRGGLGERIRCSHVRYIECEISARYPSGCIRKVIGYLSLVLGERLGWRHKFGSHPILMVFKTLKLGETIKGVSEGQDKGLTLGHPNKRRNLPERLRTRLISSEPAFQERTKGRQRTRDHFL